jgi:hypothetical protein
MGEMEVMSLCKYNGTMFTLPVERQKFTHRILHIKTMVPYDLPISFFSSQNPEE